MCGISVIISSKINPVKIKEVNDLIRHRGPDDEGYVFFFNKNKICAGGSDTPASAFLEKTSYMPSQLVENIDLLEDSYLSFGHRRLAIVDLSALGHQPMSDSSGRYWITYNGEIYNYLELREELKSLGYKFVSQTDTEVILAAYQEWGEKCMSRFNGMWAFAIYDHFEDSIFFARDRFGIKPLYYWQSPCGDLIFASEIKQFTKLEGWKARVNPQRAYDFLAWGLTDHTDETLFSKVFQLPPGSYVSFKVKSYSNQIDEYGRLVYKKWYQLAPDDFVGDFEDAAKIVKELLTDSVKLRMPADVPMGSCLSGGLDSSAIVCLLNEHLKDINEIGLQKTFSACSNYPSFDEREWVDRVVNYLNIDAHYVYPCYEKIFNDLKCVTWHQDEPFGSMSIYAQWEVFKEASNCGVRVVLDGQGADEQLAGYHNFFSQRLASLYRNNEWSSLMKEMKAMRNIHGYSFVTSLKYLANAILPEPLRDILRRYANKTNSAPIWLDEKKLGAKRSNPHALAGVLYDIRSLSVAQLTASNLQMLLHWEDRNSMAHSVESRVPFLDYRFVDLTVSLPDEFKLANGITKRILRKSMRGVLPETIINRMDKVGFVTPEEVLVMKSGINEFRVRFKDAIKKTEGIINTHAIDFFDEIYEGKRPYNHAIWRIISFGNWMDRFDVHLS